MAGFAGIMCKGMHIKVSEMLDIISNRGEFGRTIIETNDATLGVIWLNHEQGIFNRYQETGIFQIGPGNGHQITIETKGDHLVIRRGKYGIVPVYLGKDKNSNMIFASEIKALVFDTKKLLEFLPGQQMINGQISTYFELDIIEENQSPAEELASQLKHKLKDVFQARLKTNEAGIWLSGGLDSSIVTGILKEHLQNLHSFTTGMINSPDLIKAKEIADFFGTNHHEIILDKEMILKILPDVILHLETFDVQLVRSGIISMCNAWASADYVQEVFTGDAADELFAGFEYLMVLPTEDLNKELITLIKKMPGTSLQRVDRSTAAFGLTGNIIFADPEIIEFAITIPGKYKIRDGIEKWILRYAFMDMLPEDILFRPKSKIWQGAGIHSLLAEHARETISDNDFSIERQLPNGWYLSNKEQLLYYRIFREHFGEFSDLGWMGIS